MAARQFFLRADGVWSLPSGVAPADGDYGDITVSGGGFVWTIDNSVVTYAKMQNVSATSRVLGRISLGTGVVEELTGADIFSIIGASSGAALTKVDDTNVTLTLGGTPASALLKATSLTLGWTGTLGVARGGTNLGSYTAGDILYATGATTLAKLAIGSSTNVLTVSGGLPVWAAAPGGSSGANPTASVGLTAVNGSATTFLRSDGAPALSQSIAPTWTGLHIFSHGPTTSLDGGILVSNAIPIIGIRETGAAANQKVWDVVAFGSKLLIRTADDSGINNKNIISVSRSSYDVTAIDYGNSSNNPTHTLYGPVNFPGHVEFTKLATTSYDGQATFRGAYILNGYFETDQGTNEGGWDIAVNARTFSIRTASDAGTTNRNLWSATGRSGQTVSAIEYGNSTDSPTHTFFGRIIGNVGHNGAAATGNASSGTYTPTLTNVGNTSALSATVAQWMRVGNVVTVSGSVTATYTLATTSSFRISLPIASALASVGQVAGTASTTGSNGASISADATNDEALFSTGAVGVGATATHYFTFTYVVL